MAIEIARKYYLELAQLKTQLVSLQAGAMQENPEILRETSNEETPVSMSMTKCYYEGCCLMGLPLNTTVRRVYTDGKGKHVKVETFGFHEFCLETLLKDKKIPTLN